MREIAQHVMDLIENGVEAGATCVEIDLIEDATADQLVVRVADDGRGMDSEVVGRVTDPFYTSRTSRRVGLGIPMLAATAERCGGSLEIASQPRKGTTVTARMVLSHIDRPPVGDIQSTLLSALVGHSDVELVYRHSSQGAVFSLDSRAIKSELEGVPLTHPSILRWLRGYIAEGLAGLDARGASEREVTDAETEQP